jgi:hypothetical protein
LLLDENGFGHHDRGAAGAGELISRESISMTIRNSCVRALLTALALALTDGTTMWPITAALK